MKKTWKLLFVQSFYFNDAVWYYKINITCV